MSDFLVLQKRKKTQHLGNKKSYRRSAGGKMARFLQNNKKPTAYLCGSHSLSALREGRADQNG